MHGSATDLAMDQETSALRDDTPGDAAIDVALAVDRELEAAIEYKIAICGLGGVETILDFVNSAIRRRM